MQVFIEKNQFLVPFEPFLTNLLSVIHYVKDHLPLSRLCAIESNQRLYSHLTGAAGLTA